MVIGSKVRIKDTVASTYAGCVGVVRFIYDTRVSVAFDDSHCLAFARTDLEEVVDYSACEYKPCTYCITTLTTNGICCECKENENPRCCNNQKCGRVNFGYRNRCEYCWSKL
jgi:hypothetical protein